MAKLVLVALAVAALVNPSWAERYYGRSEAFDSASCESAGPPFFVQYAMLSSDDCAAYPTVTCQLQGDYYVNVACDTYDDTYTPYPDEAATYFGMGQLQNAACGDPLAGAIYYKIDTCGPQGQPDIWVKFTVDASGLQKTTCSDAACTACGEPEVTPSAMLTTSTQCTILEDDLVYFLSTDPYVAAPSVTVFTTSVDDLPGPLNTDGPVGAAKDCYADTDGTILGGWAVTYSSTKFCCTVRGEQVADASFVGCDKATAVVGYFFDTTTGLTYQNCYSDEEAATSVATPGGDLTVAVRDGAIFTSETGTLPHDQAIVAAGQFEGAYKLNRALSGDPDYIYCVGRGTVTAGIACRMNRCDDETDHFAVAGTTLSAGDFCYHTCFAA